MYMSNAEVRRAVRERGTPSAWARVGKRCSVASSVGRTQGIGAEADGIAQKMVVVVAGWQTGI
jgi:hypothetical protein